MPGHSDVPSSQPTVPPARLTAPELSGIRRLSALETVRARIALAVELGLLRPGEWLPPSDRIAAALEVSEMTARRALVSLVGDGVLERIRGRGGGTRVAARPARAAVTSTAAYRSAAGEVRMLIDRRLVLECGVTHLAAAHADDADLDRLGALVEAMDEATSWAEFHGHDERFHLTLAEASGVGAAVEQYGQALRELYRFYLPYPMEYLRESNEEHRGLVAALRDRDAGTAAGIAERHVAVLHETMFIGLPPDAVRDR
ncbi:FadR/GntR family transcriptional regulator [Prauserella muralis]|uniref:GntR family transcriptional regulator n=1 Tax=Prauserella muralis TaxID=588067 RepID=A0A2V4AI15_9PSEU|nr:FCD domain-containing protein [Prauserella muralis]PXY19281.1 GntR family transcriptional regulator [Prauserella muralis]TWE29220.1 GntR family transcriptional regulator [Prauserella muralis]